MLCHEHDKAGTVAHECHVLGHSKQSSEAECSAKRPQCLEACRESKTPAEQDHSTHGTIHWHGVRVPPETFWYHPHVRGDVQVERGLYGMLIVRSERDASIAVDADRAFVLDDVKLEATSQLSVSRGRARSER